MEERGAIGSKLKHKRKQQTTGVRQKGDVGIEIEARNTGRTWRGERGEGRVPRQEVSFFAIFVVERRGELLNLECHF